MGRSAIPALTVVSHIVGRGAFAWKKWHTREPAQVCIQFGFALCNLVWDMSDQERPDQEGSDSDEADVFIDQHNGEVADGEVYDLEGDGEGLVATKPFTRPDQQTADLLLYTFAP